MGGAAARRTAGGGEGGPAEGGDGSRKGRGSSSIRGGGDKEASRSSATAATVTAAAVRGPWWRPSMVSDTALAGLYLFALQALVLALVFGKALHNNQGRKFVRVKQDGCHVAWADMGAEHGSPIACCSRTDRHDPEAWDAAICTAATSAVTSYLTSGLACVLPFLPLALNALFSLRHPREVKAGQRRRFFLYAGIIAFRTAVLLICLNRLQAHLQGEEGDSCWYSALRHDGRCRARFDFADHGVLFISQYLTIQTFETLAVLREASNPVHLVSCLAAACLISLASLLGFYATVSFFHTRLESAVALLLSLLTVQLPLLLIISGRLGSHKWARLGHYIHSVRRP